MVKVAQKNASGCKVCHLESRLQMRFVLRSSGQITFALGFRLTQDFFLKDLFGNLFKRLAPGRAAGGIFNLAASGGEVCHLESRLRMLPTLVPRVDHIR